MATEQSHPYYTKAQLKKELGERLRAARNRARYFHPTAPDDTPEVTEARKVVDR